MNVNRTPTTLPARPTAPPTQTQPSGKSDGKTASQASTDTVVAESSGTVLGRQGLKAMFDPSLRYGKEQARIGGSYLSSIGSQSELHSERVVSNTAINAFNSVRTWRGQVAVASVALATLGAGVVGPLGPVLAQVGYDAMFDPAIQEVRDQAAIGIRFTESIVQHGDTEEQKSASAALNASQSVSTVRTQAILFSSYLGSQK